MKTTKKTATKKVSKKTLKSVKGGYSRIVIADTSGGGCGYSVHCPSGYFCGAGNTCERI